MHAKYAFPAFAAAVAYAQSSSSASPSVSPANGPASSATGLPAATYEATLPEVNFNEELGSDLAGSVRISSSPSSPGVQVSVNIQGLPDTATYGDFIYHVHAVAVPENGNCTATLAHLDPTLRGEVPICDPNAPTTCQVGDLSGKHGNITTSDFTASYDDAFLSTDPSSPSYFGDKSIVFHTFNKTRIACANFVMVNGGGMNGTMPSNGTNATITSSSPTSSPSTTSGSGSPSETEGGDSPEESQSPEQAEGAAGIATFGFAAVAAALFAMVL